MVSKILEGVKLTLTRENGGYLSDEEVRGLKKAVIMDKYLASLGVTVSSSDIFFAIKTIFDIDLTTKPVLSNESLEQYLNHSEVTGAKIREIINDIYGVNLDAISSLEGSRISLFSKGQWIVQNDRDLFVVHTGIRDIDARVYPTTFFMERTGLSELPDQLKQSLTKLGYDYDESIGSYFYSNPTGDPVPDSFKGRTMGALIDVVRGSYSDI
jgi:hypothetical protein